MPRDTPPPGEACGADLSLHTRIRRHHMCTYEITRHCMRTGDSSGGRDSQQATKHKQPQAVLTARLGTMNGQSGRMRHCNTVASI